MKKKWFALAVFALGIAVPTVAFAATDVMEDCPWHCPFCP
jgi:hypothetical protein